MAVSEQFHRFVLDQLGAVRRVTGRRMFGGVGYYAGPQFFALADNDTLYFKVDATSKLAFEREGMRAFQPFGADGKPMMYYELPPRVLEDEAQLGVWMARAIEVARLKRTRKR